MNNKIVFNHPALRNVTFDDLINDLRIIINDNQTFEKIVLSILRESLLNDEDISTVFNYSITNRLEWILSLLENNIQ